jgi:SAM-dependent methyltransferase
MDPLDCQQSYWDKVAGDKRFTHPLQMDRFREVVPPGGTVLDYGCGYGRICAFLMEHGYRQVIGVDISPEMISRGRRLDSRLDLRHIRNNTLPFENDTFDACTLLAVLNCIPTDSGQQALVEALYRVLRPNGILYLSDYPLQPDARNTDRYKRYENAFGQFGVFRLPDGAVLRHHNPDWIYSLLERFDIIWEDNMTVLTMNGSKAVIFQIMAVKRPAKGTL